MKKVFILHNVSITGYLRDNNGEFYLTEKAKGATQYDSYPEAEAAAKRYFEQNPDDTLVMFAVEGVFINAAS